MVRNSTRTAANILLTVSSAAGRNDNNSFYGNTISGAYNGFVLAGCNDGVSPFTFTIKIIKLESQAMAILFRILEILQELQEHQEFSLYTIIT